MMITELIARRTRALTTEQILGALEHLEPTDPREEARMVRAALMDTLEGREPNHPVVQAEIARLNAEYDA